MKHKGTVHYNSEVPSGKAVYRVQPTTACNIFMLNGHIASTWKLVTCMPCLDQKIKLTTQRKKGV